MHAGVRMRATFGEVGEALALTRQTLTRADDVPMLEKKRECIPQIQTCAPYMPPKGVQPSRSFTLFDSPETCVDYCAPAPDPAACRDFCSEASTDKRPKVPKDVIEWVEEEAAKDKKDETPASTISEITAESRTPWVALLLGGGAVAVVVGILAARSRK